MVLITYFTPKVREGIFFFTPPSSHKERKKQVVLYHSYSLYVCVCVCFNFEFIIWNYDTFFFASSSFFDVWFDLLVSWFASHKRRSPMMTAHSEFRNSLSLFYDDVMMMYPPHLFWWVFIDFVSALLLIWYFCFWTGIIPPNSVCHFRLDSYQT